MTDYTLDYRWKKAIYWSGLSIDTKAFTLMLSIRANGHKDPALISFSEEKIDQGVLFQNYLSSNGYFTKQILTTT